MNTRTYLLGDDVSAENVTHISITMYSVLGGMLWRGWPDIDMWLPDLVPELSGVYEQSITLEFELSARELRKTLSHDLSCVYRLESANAFATAFIASLRHSELSGAFVPESLPRQETVKLLGAVDYFDFLPKTSLIFPIPWTIGVGVALNEIQSVVVLSSDNTMLLDMEKIMTQRFDDKQCFIRVNS